MLAVPLPGGLHLAWAPLSGQAALVQAAGTDPRDVFAPDPPLKPRDGPVAPEVLQISANAELDSVCAALRWSSRHGVPEVRLPAGPVADRTTELRVHAVRLLHPSAQLRVVCSAGARSAEWLAWLGQRADCLEVLLTPVVSPPQSLGSLTTEVRLTRPVAAPELEHIETIARELAAVADIVSIVPVGAPVAAAASALARAVPILEAAGCTAELPGLRLEAGCTRCPLGEDGFVVGTDCVSGCPHPRGLPWTFGQVPESCSHSPAVDENARAVVQYLRTRVDERCEDCPVRWHCTLCSYRESLCSLPTPAQCTLTRRLLVWRLLRALEAHAEAERWLEEPCEGSTPEWTHAATVIPTREQPPPTVKWRTTHGFTWLRDRGGAQLARRGAWLLLEGRDAVAWDLLVRGRGPSPELGVGRDVVLALTDRLCAAGFLAEAEWPT